MRFNRGAGFVAAVARFAIAVVADFVALDAAVAAKAAGFTGNQADPVVIDCRAVKGTAIAVILVAVVASLGTLSDSVPALLALRAENGAAVARLHFGAIVSTSVPTIPIAVVAELHAFQDAVAAIVTFAGAAIPTSRGFLLAVEATTVTGESVTVVAGFGRQYLAVSTLDARFTGIGTVEALFHRRTVRTTAVAAVGVAVVAKFVRILTAISAQLAGNARCGADPAPRFDLTDLVTSVGRIRVAIVAGFGTFEYPVPTQKAVRASYFTAPLRTFGLALVIAAIARCPIAVVAFFVGLDDSVSATGLHRAGARFPSSGAASNDALEPGSVDLASAARSARAGIEGFVARSNNNRVVLTPNQWCAKQDGPEPERQRSVHTWGLQT